MTRIGITERGDAGLDLSWRERLDSVDGAVLVTKNLTPAFTRALLEEYTAGRKLLLHCGCTGWGGTQIEPNVPHFHTQLQRLAELTRSFPKALCVLRIDPIIPTDAGLGIVGHVLAEAKAFGLLGQEPIRVRISILDEYPHVRERLIARGLQPFYGGSFYAPKPMMDKAIETLNALHEKYGVVFETCAELALTGPAFERIGCVSTRDLELLNLTVPENGAFNPQNRHGCLCLAGKTELLRRPRPCGHNCAYCYWKG